MLKGGTALGGTSLHTLSFQKPHVSASAGSAGAEGLDHRPNLLETPRHRAAAVPEAARLTRRCPPRRRSTAAGDGFRASTCGRRAACWSWAVGPKLMGFWSRRRHRRGDEQRVPAASRRDRGRTPAPVSPCSSGERQGAGERGIGWSGRPGLEPLAPWSATHHPRVSS